MDNFIVQIRPYLEILYFLSTIFLASIAVYGIKQIRLMKSDMKARSEHAAKEKAIEASSEYLTSFVPLDNRHYLECLKRKVPISYTGPIGDFTPNSLPTKEADATLKRVQGAQWLTAINKLQSIAAYFTTGVADEQVGFHIIGRTFCGTVGRSYDLISFLEGRTVIPISPT